MSQLLGSILGQANQLTQNAFANANQGFGGNNYQGFGGGSNNYNPLNQRSSFASVGSGINNGVPYSYNRIGNGNGFNDFNPFSNFYPGVVSSPYEPNSYQHDPYRQNSYSGFAPNYHQQQNSHQQPNSYQQQNYNPNYSNQRHNSNQHQNHPNHGSFQQPSSGVSPSRTIGSFQQRPSNMRAITQSGNRAHDIYALDSGSQIDVNSVKLKNARTNNFRVNQVGNSAEHIYALNGGKVKSNNVNLRNGRLDNVAISQSGNRASNLYALGGGTVSANSVEIDGGGGSWNNGRGGRSQPFSFWG
jgi:hypothetical protein